MSGIRVTVGGVLTEQWNDATRTYTDFRTDPDTTRPYTAQENAEADARAQAATEDANEATIGSKLVTVDLPAMQAIIDQLNADLRADPSQEIKDIARAVRRLTRKVEQVLDGTD